MYHSRSWLHTLCIGYTGALAHDRYEATCRYFKSRKPPPEPPRHYHNNLIDEAEEELRALSWPELMTAGGLAGVTAWVVSPRPALQLPPVAVLNLLAMLMSRPHSLSTSSKPVCKLSRGLPSRCPCIKSAQRQSGKKAGESCLQV